MHLRSTWFGVEAAAKIRLYCESVERGESQGRYPVILQLLESSMWKQQQLCDTEQYKHCSGKTPVLTTAYMHGGSLTVQLQNGSKRSKAHPWSASSTPAVTWKKGWMDRFPKHLQALKKDVPAQQWSKKTCSDTKAWVGEPWSNFSHLNRFSRSQ